MRFTPNTPIEYSLRPFTVCTPIGVESVRIEGDEVVGRWSQDLTDFHGPQGRYLVEDFVNWPNEPADIVRFTVLYAPLDWHETAGVDSWALPSGGKEFRFKIESWRATQALFRRMWEAQATGRYESTGVAGLSAADGIDVRGRHVVYRAGSLKSFLLMEFITAPLMRLRKCARPNCETPFFVARHLRQQYCSPACAEWAQGEWKKKWWDKRGEAWLEQRKRKIKTKRHEQRPKTRSRRKN